VGEPDRDERGFFAGLRELAESAFPKRCPSCGRVYETAAAFIAETRPVQADRSGLKESVDDEGAPLVELYRNCVCGSTLMDYFSDRRDLSAAGLARRRKFDALLEYLVEQGLERETARGELLKVLRGEKSGILRTVVSPPKR
jgi:hypothetical protein